MAEKKKQHFVPQFYMRNFSADAEQKRFSLDMIDADRHVPGATIKDQAHKDYFYGKDGVEDDLGKLESATAPIIAQVIAGGALPERTSDEHVTLLTFVLFQDARTPLRAAALNEQAEKIAKALGSGFPDLKDEVDQIEVDDREAPVMALRMMAEIAPFALDLRWKVLENKTGRLFITSDHPTVKYNQFLEKRNTLGSNTGLANRGLQIFMPISPRHLLMLYDGDVYRVGGRQHLQERITVGEGDVRILNQMQAANADNILYFSQDTDFTYIHEAVEAARPHRRAEQIELKEHRAIDWRGREGTLMQTSGIDLRLGVKLDCSVILSSAAGPRLNGHPVQLRNPELVYRFEASRGRFGPYDPREVVEAFRARYGRK